LLSILQKPLFQSLRVSVHCPSVPELVDSSRRSLSTLCMTQISSCIVDFLVCRKQSSDLTIFGREILAAICSSRSINEKSPDLLHQIRSPLVIHQTLSDRPSGRHLPPNLVFDPLQCQTVVVFDYCTTYLLAYGRDC
ncbi:hypothetical protein KCU66_g41, partial [Aureobasidium melanogenum]